MTLKDVRSVLQCSRRVTGRGGSFWEKNMKCFPFHDFKTCRHYQNNYYRQAYMVNALTEIGASSCEITLDVEELQGGRYLIGHELSIQ